MRSTIRHYGRDTLAAAFALGSLVGNVTDADFRDIDIHLPFTPEPSGERAEPEESAK